MVTYMKEKLVSIIIPAYNEEKKISECLESLLSQTYKNIEIIVVNDGSKDSTLKILKEYEKKYKNIKALSKSNGGISSARNLGVKYSNGEYISFVDGNDIVTEDFIESLVTNLIKHDAQISVCAVTNNNIDNKITVLNHKESCEYLLNNPNYCGYSFNKLFIKKIMDKVAIKKDKYFFENVRYAEDLDFNSRYYEYVKKSVFINQLKYDYRLNSETSISLTPAYNENIDKFIVLKRIIDSFEKYNKEILDELYYLYLYNKLELIYLYSKKHKKISIDNYDKELYKKIKKSKKLKLKQKIRIRLYYMFPIKSFKLKYRLLKWKK